MWNLDRLQDPYGFGLRMYLRDLKMRASDYMKTRVYHGMIDDEYGPAVIPLIGADRVLWGSGFPHIRSIGREAQEHVHTQLACLSREDQEKIVSGNAANVFHVG